MATKKRESSIVSALAAAFEGLTATEGQRLLAHRRAGTPVCCGRDKWMLYTDGMGGG